MVYKATVFLDRDGVINQDSVEYIRDVKNIIFKDSVFAALKKLATLPVNIFVVTNQSGIARGYLSLETLNRIHTYMLEEISKHSGRIDKIYYCPHHPDEHCSCRKPATGMLLQASKDFLIDKKRMVLIGDSATDIEAGHNFNCKTILIKSIKSPKELSLLEKKGIKATYLSTDLFDAVNLAEKWLFHRDFNKK